jgi:UDP-glucose 4-epimerase
MKVAVTGAGGFIGAYLTRKLALLGHEVLAIDTFLRGRPSRLAGIPGDVSVLNLDVRDKAALSAVLKGVTAVFHLAAVNGTENFYKYPQLVLDVGVRGALAVVEACIDAGVPDLIFASSAEVYQTPAVVPTPETIDMVIPDPLNPRYSYGGSKLISELIAFNYGRDKFRKIQVFRPHNVYGPDMGWKHVIPQLIAKVEAAMLDGSGVVQMQGDGSETRAFCYVDDIVDGILAIWSSGETMNVYHIGTMDEVSIGHLAALIAKAMRAEISFSSGPAADGGTPRRCPDISKLAKLGYVPAIPLSEGIDRTVNWYRSNPQPIDLNALL